MPGSIEVTNMLDIRAPEIVQFDCSEDGKVLWINVDGICRLRVTDTKGIMVDFSDRFLSVVRESLGDLSEEL
jgi:hypothetical protein